MIHITLFVLNSPGYVLTNILGDIESDEKVAYGYTAKEVQLSDHITKKITKKIVSHQINVILVAILYLRNGKHKCINAFSVDKLKTNPCGLF